MSGGKHAEGSWPPSEGKKRASRKVQQPASDDNTITEDVEPLANSVANVVGQQYGRAQDLASDTLHRSEDIIRRNPFSAILASLGLGFLLGVVRGARK